MQLLGHICRNPVFPKVRVGTGGSPSVKQWLNVATASRSPGVDPVAKTARRPPQLAGRGFLVSIRIVTSTARTYFDATNSALKTYAADHYDACAFGAVISIKDGGASNGGSAAAQLQLHRKRRRCRRADSPYAVRDDTPRPPILKFPNPPSSRTSSSRFLIVGAFAETVISRRRFPQSEFSVALFDGSPNIRDIIRMPIFPVSITRNLLFISFRILE